MLMLGKWFSWSIFLVYRRFIFPILVRCIKICFESSFTTIWCYHSNKTRIIIVKLFSAPELDKQALLHYPVTTHPPQCHFQLKSCVASFPPCAPSRCRQGPWPVAASVGHPRELATLPPANPRLRNPPRSRSRLPTNTRGAAPLDPPAATNADRRSHGRTLLGMSLMEILKQSFYVHT